MKKDEKAKRAKQDKTPNTEEVAPDTQPVNAEPPDGAAETEQPETQPEKPEETEPTQEEWAAALTQTVKERDQYKDGMIRAQADFANFKRRNQTARTDAYDEGARETISAILPVLDNLELALMHAEQAGENAALTEGVKMTLKQFAEILGKLGLEEIPALGEKFDPELHNAVMRAEGGEADTVCEVFQKGYRIKDRIIRYAMVKVFSGAE